MVVQADHARIAMQPDERTPQLAILSVQRSGAIAECRHAVNLKCPFAVARGWRLLADSASSGTSQTADLGCPTSGVEVSI